MTRRRTSYKIRCMQMLGTAGLLVGTAFLLHAAMHLLFTLALGGR
jgi:hypothetical protein